MDGIGVERALAQATSALQHHHDLTEFLVELIDVCQRILAVESTGVMLVSRGGRLQLLAASSHRGVELELYQSQIDEGPCVDAVAHRVSIIVAGDRTLRVRWPAFGPAMIEAGFRSVHSTPLLWAGSALGAMALFRREPVALDAREDSAAQEFADVVVHAVMDDPESESPVVEDRIEAALAGRVLVEQAKGVIARVEGVGAAEAYAALLARAAATGLTVTAAAEAVITQARRGELNRS